jgi:membrane protease YdiL (CAAX protease family)/predicted enzyme related to lactoylglutathione lyase
MVEHKDFSTSSSIKKGMTVMADTSAGALVEVILPVHDMNSQVAFYRDQLGLCIKEPQGVHDFRDFYAVELLTGNCTLKLHVDRQAAGKGEHSQLVFRVADVQSSRERLLANGITVGEIYSPEEGILHCDAQDPEGNSFTLESRNDIPFTPIEAIPTPSAMPVYVPLNTKRGRSIALLRDNKWLMAGELLLVCALVVITAQLPEVTIVSPLLLIMGLLWLSGNNWSKLGLRKQGPWRDTIFSGLITGVAFTLVAMFIILPLSSYLAHITPNLRIWAPHARGDFLLFVGNLITIWSSQAVAEELIFRGYLLNRLGDLCGRDARGWILASFVQAAICGLSYLNGGFVAVMATSLLGLVLSLLYFLTRQHLWPCIIAHGVVGTLFLLLSLLIS